MSTGARPIVLGGLMFLALWVVLALLCRLAWWGLVIASGHLSWEWILSIIVGLAAVILLVRWMPDPKPATPAVPVEVVPPEPEPPTLRPVLRKRDVN